MTVSVICEVVIAGVSERFQYELVRDVCVRLAMGGLPTVGNIGGHIGVRELHGRSREDSLEPALEHSEGACNGTSGGIPEGTRRLEVPEDVPAEAPADRIGSSERDWLLVRTSRSMFRIGVDIEVESFDSLVKSD